MIGRGREWMMIKTRIDEFKGRKQAQLRMTGLARIKI